MAHSKIFYLNGGKKFSSLKSFVKELANMPKHVYEHHVNGEKNDFHLWVKHSMKNETLAKRIEEKLDKIEMELEVLRYLVHDISKEKSKSKTRPKKVELKQVVKKIKSTPNVEKAKVVKKVSSKK